MPHASPDGRGDRWVGRAGPTLGLSKGPDARPGGDRRQPLEFCRVVLSDNEHGGGEDTRGEERCRQKESTAFFERRDQLSWSGSGAAKGNGDEKAGQSKLPRHELPHVGLVSVVGFHPSSHRCLRQVLGEESSDGAAKLFLFIGIDKSHDTCLISPNLPVLSITSMDCTRTVTQGL